VRSSNFKASIAFLALFFFGCASPAQNNVNTGVAVLSDSPAIEFKTGGWSYTNTTNPFLLTPDYLTNAMIGVSRLKPGEPLLKGGPIISTSLTTAEISPLLADRLSSKTDLTLETLTLGGREVVHAIYKDNEKMGQEYAFVLNGFVVHVLLIAKSGSYYEAGSGVVVKIVESIKAR